MRKLLLALLALLPITASAAIALTQTQTHKYTAVTSQVITFTSPVATQDVIGIFIACNDGTAGCQTAPTSITDNAGDALITALAWTRRSGDYDVGVYLFVVGTGSSSFSITVASASGQTYAASIFDYSGVNSTPLDGATALATGTGTSASSASLTPSQTGDQQLAFVAITSGNTVSAWGGGLVQEGQNTSGAPASAWADLGLSSTASVTASATISSSAPWGIAQLLLAPAGGGSSCTHAGIGQAGAFVVPTAGSTVVRLANGSFGTVNCTSTSYKQQQGAFGVN